MADYDVNDVLYDPVDDYDEPNTNVKWYWSFMVVPIPKEGEFILQTDIAEVNIRKKYVKTSEAACAALLNKYKGQKVVVVFSGEFNTGTGLY